MLFVLETWDRGQRPRDQKIWKGNERGRKGKKKMDSVREMEEDRGGREIERATDMETESRRDKVREGKMDREVRERLRESRVRFTGWKTEGGRE